MRSWGPWRRRGPRAPTPSGPAWAWGGSGRRAWRASSAWGNENLCPTQKAICIGNHGGFADRIRTDGRFAFPLPAGLDSASAAPLLCGGATVFAPLVPPRRGAEVGRGGDWDRRARAPRAALPREDGRGGDGVFVDPRQARRVATAWGAPCLLLDGRPRAEEALREPRLRPLHRAGAARLDHLRADPQAERHALPRRRSSRPHSDPRCRSSSSGAEDGLRGATSGAARRSARCSISPRSTGSKGAQIETKPLGDVNAALDRLQKERSAVLGMVARGLRTPCGAMLREL